MWCEYSEVILVNVLWKCYVELLRDYSTLVNRDQFGERAVKEPLWATQRSPW